VVGAKLLEELPGLAAECLPDDPGDLIGPGIAIDETAHLKKGRSTACVAPQHAGRHRQGGELRELGVRRAGHRARAGMGRFRRVHAEIVG